MPTNYAKILIDKLKNSGVKVKDIAEQLGTKDTIVSEWRTGKRRCMPPDLAALAYMAGYDATQILARATAEEYEGTPKGQILARALGKTLLATGGVLATASAQAATTGWIDTMYRMFTKRNRFLIMKQGLFLPRNRTRLAID